MSKSPDFELAHVLGRRHEARTERELREYVPDPVAGLATVSDLLERDCERRSFAATFLGFVESREIVLDGFVRRS